MRDEGCARASGPWPWPARRRRSRPSAPSGVAATGSRAWRRWSSWACSGWRGAAGLEEVGDRQASARSRQSWQPPAAAAVAPATFVGQIGDGPDRRTVIIDAQEQQVVRRLPGSERRSELATDAVVAPISAACTSRPPGYGLGL